MRLTLSRIASVLFGTLLVAGAAWFFARGPAITDRLDRRSCEGLYVRARSPADSDRVDASYPPTFDRKDPSRMTCGQLRRLEAGKSSRMASVTEGVLQLRHCTPVDPSESLSGEWQAIARVDLDTMSIDSVMINFLPVDASRAAPDFVLPEGLPPGLEPVVLDSALRRCQDAALTLLRTIDSSRDVQERLAELLPVVIRFHTGAPPSN